MLSEESSFVQSKQYAEFITVTCHNWQHVLADNQVKDIIISSLSYLSKVHRVSVYAFVIMSNHFHVLWQVLGDHERSAVQRDLLKYTSQKILKLMKDEESPVLADLLVKAKDRKYQLWQRNSLGIPLWSDKVVWQKLAYIHDNPVKAGLCKRAEDYLYSSAGFYWNADKR
ncbi:MAG TPA: transposase [Ohtaekwangia sp.]